MSSDVGHSPAEEPTHANRKDFSYVGISCTNYGYTDYSRQHRNFSPVSRLALERPAGGSPKIDFDRRQTSLSAVNSPENEILIVESFDRSEIQGNEDHPSVIADRILTLYGPKTKDEFKKRSKSAGPAVRNIYGPNYRQDFLEIAEGSVDPKKEQLKPSKFPGSVKERATFVEQLLKKDIREGVKALEELKKPPRFTIPSSKPSEEYYIKQRELEKEREIKFNLRLKEAEKRLRAQEKEEAERRRLAEEEERKEHEERLRAEAEEAARQEAEHVQAVPEYTRVEQIQSVEQVVVNTSFGSNESLNETAARDREAVDEVDRSSSTKEVTTTVIKRSGGDTEDGGESVETTTITTVTTTKTTQLIEEKEITVTEKESESEAQEPKEPARMSAGQGFIDQLDAAEAKIRARVATCETYLSPKNSEDVQGTLLAAIGKGKLLIDQKCTQFRGLCIKNMKPTVPGEFPTTNEDLAGFWDMICIQIDQVLETFDRIDRLQENKWKEESPKKSPSKIKPSK